MSRSLGLICFLLLAPTAACKKDESPPSPPGPNMSGAMQRKMANCPSAVRGAVTQTTPTGDGIDVTVTATDPTAALAIMTLAEFHARTPSRLTPFPHTGLRGDTSRIGFCPIVHGIATITTTFIPGGARIHLAAISPMRVSELQALVEARAARLRSFPTS